MFNFACNAAVWRWWKRSVHFL